MTTQPFAVWSSITLLRTPAVARDPRDDERGLVARHQRLDRDALGRCGPAAPLRVRRALGRDELVAAQAVAQLRTRRGRRGGRSRARPTRARTRSRRRRTGSGFAPDRDPHEEEQRDDEHDRDRRAARATRPLRSRRARSTSLVGEPAGVVRRERDAHVAPAHVEVGMMVGALGEEADPHDERDRVGERARSSNVFSISSPARDQPGSAASAAATSASARSGHRPHSTPAARVGHTRGVPRPPRLRSARPTSSSTAAAASPCTWADGTDVALRARGAAAQLPVRGMPRPARAGSRSSARRPVAAAPLTAESAPSWSAVGPHDPLERRPRHRDLRLEHPAGLATRRATGEP